jgi:ParB-like chromosome segregation protein Spo0J
MNVFTEVYNKSVELLKVPALDDSWKTIEANLKTLLEDDGPNAGKAKVLDDLRDQLKKAAKGKGVAKTAMAEEIAKASKTGAAGYQERAALIKTMQHFHMVAKKGGQSIWVVDPPKSFVTWPYDQLAGKNETDLKTELQADTEVFGSGNRKMMSDSLQLARKWSADVQIKLSSPNAKTLEKVKRWFHAEGASDDDAKATAGTLAEGFKKIHATCNSSRVIFSDRPHLRASGEWDNVYASVNAADVMPVIYIFQVFIKAGKRNALGSVPKLWLCALTVVHELTHKLVRTEDIRYDDDGLKPGDSFTAEQALKNADSWAYFAADMVGALSKGTITKVLA